VSDYPKLIAEAPEYFWKTRVKQRKAQGSKDGAKDRGSRGAVTGGAQLDGFISLLKNVLIEAGLPAHIIHEKKTILPGYFRATKNWDLVVVCDDRLLAAIELKSHVGPSFGNNFNNRVEEALGSATDIWTAYREGAFKLSPRPWLGWLMLLEDAPESQIPVEISSPHFDVFDAFKTASYATRYEVFCKYLVRERLYDAACLLLSNRVAGVQGSYHEPDTEIGFKGFAVSLKAHAMAHIETHEQ